MAHQVTIGGERLGSGKKMKASLHNYERSTHDLGYVFRSTMAAGTLVPFMSRVALPGDTFDINLNADVLTMPTVGPLFGSYKVQLDVFQVPIRLYQGKLHMNMLGIGMDMSKVTLPQIELEAAGINIQSEIDNQQINPSCLLAYLGIRGLGYSFTGGIDTTLQRRFNAIPLLGYWDIYKNYYANKQEEIGAVIHKDPTPYNLTTITAISLINIYDADSGSDGVAVELTEPDPLAGPRVIVNNASTISILAPLGDIDPDLFDPGSFIIFILIPDGTGGLIAEPRRGDQLFDTWTITPDVNGTEDLALGSNPIMSDDGGWPSNGLRIGWAMYQPAADDQQDTEPKVVTFPLENIDTMRQNILAHLSDAAFLIDDATASPYGLLNVKATQPDDSVAYSKQYSQEGLGLKTYQSDLFNNWISTEWIDGPDGISEITAVSTAGDSFTIDELNMSKKIYDMLNRIAISGGSYDDWLDAVYTHERQRSAENPMYLGGLIKNVVFQEVIANAASEGQPLGTLAGRGKIGNHEKGGKIVAKIDEPSYLMGIVSLTPHIDYSQGNTWDMNLLTLNDLHKPGLDEIGFQDLVTDQMAWFDTSVDTGLGVINYKSAGKQPAWLNYMTEVNRVYGNFAIQSSQMFMVLNRRYEPTFTAQTSVTIKDLTTYIDPTKFNHIFADTRRDAQNFWVQIGVDIQARRKMSAKIMPNL